MRTWAKGTRAVLLTAGFVALGASTVFPAGAYADSTSGQSSVAGGNQLNLPVSVPIDVSGNGAAAAGHADAGSRGGTSVVNGGRGGQQTSGQSSVGGGNQVNAPISAPINACGNAVAIFGTADAGCKGGADVRNGGAGGSKTSGTYSVAGGNQVNAPISAPINACGNAVAIFGTADAGCEGGAKVVNRGGGAGTTSGRSSVAGGNQVYAPVSAPVNVCGNAVALLGDAVAGCEGGASVKNIGGSGGQRTSGQSSVGGGNQLNAPISAPVDLCGNAVGNAPAGCDGGASVRNEGSGTNRTSGQSSVLGGNQVHAPVGVPVDVCGNAVALLGNAGAECEGGAVVTNGSGGRGDTTSGRSGVLAGNQVEAPVSAPVNVCGNAVAVLGDASAGCVGTAVVGGSGMGGNTTSGQSGVGAGNQVTAPVKAPVDVCGNVAAVLGEVDPNCGNGSPGGGVITADRAHQDAPVGLGLPVVPGLTRTLPLSPGSALPAVPQLPAQTPMVPMSAPAAAPLTGVTEQLPVQAPTVPQLPVQTPATGRTPQSQPAKIARVRHAAPTPSGLTDLAGLLPTGLPTQALPTQSLPTGLPTRALPTQSLPTGVPAQALPTQATGLPLGLPATLPGQGLPTSLPAALPMRGLPTRSLGVGLPTGSLPVGLPTRSLPADLAASLPGRALPPGLSLRSLPAGVAASLPGRGLPAGLPPGLPGQGLPTGLPIGLPVQSLPAGALASTLPTSGLRTGSQANGLPIAPLTNALPSTPAGTLPTSPLASGLPTGTLANSVPTGTSANGLPTGTVTDALPTGTVTNALPGNALANGLPTSTVTNALPGNALVSGLPVGQVPVGVRRAEAAQQAVPTLPGLGAVPVTGHLNTPQVGGVAPMRPMAAVEPVASGADRSAMYALTVGAVLGAASIVVAAARRIRRSAR